MTFSIAGFARVDRGTLNPIYLLQPNPADNNRQRATGTFKQFNYFANTILTNNDTLDDIGAPGYFDTVFPELKAGDVIMAYSQQDTATGTFYVVSVTPNSANIVITERFNFGPFTVDTAQFEDGAVTYSKIQEVSAQSLIGNPRLAEFAPVEITLGAGLEFLDTILISSEGLLDRTAGTITAAEFNGMYDAPIDLIGADAPDGFYYLLDTFTFRQKFGAAQYAGGGTVKIQYGNAVHGAGVAASQTIAAATINGIAASSILVGRQNTSFATASANGASLFLTNDTAAFTTGDGDWEYTVTYRLVPV